MWLFLLLCTIAIAFGIYSFATMKMPTRAAAKGLHETLHPDRRKIDLSDRAILPLAQAIAPRVKFDETRLAGIHQDLMDARMELTPEEYLILPWVKGGLLWLLGLLFCFGSAVFGIAVIGAGVLIFWDARTRAGRAVKRRRYNIHAEMPEFVQHIIDAGKPPVLINIIKSYLPTAGKTLHAELVQLLADMQTATSETQSSHEIALSRFSSRIRVDAVTRITLGLIAMDRGEDMRTYFQGLLNELASWRKSQKLRIAAKRPSETFLATVLLFLSIGAVIFVSVYLYFTQSVSGFFVS